MESLIDNIQELNCIVKYLKENMGVYAIDINNLYNRIEFQCEKDSLIDLAEKIDGNIKLSREDNYIEGYVDVEADDRNSYRFFYIERKR